MKKEPGQFTTPQKEPILTCGTSCECPFSHLVIVKVKNVQDHLAPNTSMRKQFQGENRGGKKEKGRGNINVLNKDRNVAFKQKKKGALLRGSSRGQFGWGKAISI